MSAKGKLSLLLVILLAFALVVAGCGSKEPAPAPAPPSEGDPAPVQEAVKDYPKTLTLGSASIGGVYHVYGGAWAQIIERSLGVPTAVEVTGGPNQNMILIQNKDAELGMITMGPAWEAWHGEGDWTGGVEHKDVRVIFPMYNTYSSWWASEKSGIKSLGDLEGKTIGVGPAGGTSGTYHPRILELLGIKTTNRLAGASDLASQHIDGQIAANSFASGIPMPTVLETAAQMKINVFGVDGEYRDKVVSEWPYWSPAVIPASTYDFLKDDVETIGIWNMAVAHKDLSDEFVYDMVKAVFENQSDLVIATKSAEETVPENISNNNWMWMHPGAIRYYEEIGIKLSPDVYPPEYKK
ncbi:MAG: TAXI family TRAP transporter solute-binding subunit [Bacillota bacterium]